MKIYCRICRHAMESPDNAALGEQMARHMIARHQKEAAALKDEIQYAMALVSGFLLTTRFVDIPNSELELRALYDQTQQQILELLGLGAGALKTAN